MTDAITIDNVLEPLRLYLSVMEQRITDLEGASACSPASPAPSSVGPSARGGESPSSPSSPSSGAAGATVSSDPSAAIRADPGRPKWLTEECLPLPEGVDRVWGSTGKQLWCYPGHHYWSNLSGWEQCAWTEDRMGSGMFHAQQVYHVPPPQPEKAKPAAASAWEEWENAFIAGPDQPSHWEQFNRWVAAREKAAVEARGKLDYQQGFADGQHVAENKNRLREKIINAAARLAPKPDAGRADRGEV